MMTFFWSALEFSGKMELCKRENLFLGLRLNLVEKIHERSQAIKEAMRCHVFQKGAIVQKWLKTAEF